MYCFSLVHHLKSISRLCRNIAGLCCISDLLVPTAETNGLSAADALYAEIAHWKMAKPRDRAITALMTVVPEKFQSPEMWVVKSEVYSII
jgi:hypothetical protein